MGSGSGRTKASTCLPRSGFLEKIEIDRKKEIYQIVIRRIKTVFKT
jgi:hypothetical protein